MGLEAPRYGKIFVDHGEIITIVVTYTVISSALVVSIQYVYICSVRKNI